MKELDKPQNIIVAGVGGQGAISMAQLVLGAAWRSEYKVLQSEVHGMSQRGGAVNAQVIFDSEEVTSPVVMEGSADVLIGLEPLETLRYVHLMKKDALIVSSNVTVKNMDGYPDEEKIFAELASYDHIKVVDTKAHAVTLKNKHAGNMTLLGMASKVMPIEVEVWKAIIKEFFGRKGDVVVEKNIEAFEFGRNL